MKKINGRREGKEEGRKKKKEGRKELRNVRKIRQINGKYISSIIQVGTVYLCR